MTFVISPTSSLRRGPFVVLHSAGRAAIAMAGVFVIGSSFLTTTGCDRSPGGATAVQQPSAVLPAREASTNPAAMQYVSSANSGQAEVSGTSSLHGWSVKSTAIKGDAQFSGQWNAGPAGAVTLQYIDLVIPVDSIKSTEGSGMDNTMYGALKSKQFPDITYKLTKATLKALPSAPGSAYHFETTGQLTIAGAAHAVDLDLAVVPHDDGKLTITTDVGLKMTDFGVAPPTAMVFIKSGDAITVKATWELTGSTTVAGK